MFASNINGGLTNLDVIELFLLLWILFLTGSVFLMRIILNFKERTWEAVLESLLSKLQENADMHPLNGRITQWLQFEENLLFNRLRDGSNPERLNEVLYSIVRDVLANERMELLQDDWQFIGPNGDNKEYLHRNDIEGLYFRYEQ